MNPKPLSQSRTIWGAVAMFAAFLLQQFHVEVKAEELTDVLVQAVDAVQVLLGVGGFLLTIYGRIKAARPVKIGG